MIAALAHAPGLLDFYVWIAWKSWTVNGQAARIPIFGANGLSHQLGTAEYSVDRAFTHKISQWLKHVKLLWPECPVRVSSGWRLSDRSIITGIGGSSFERQKNRLFGWRRLLNPAGQERAD